MDTTNEGSGEYEDRNRAIAQARAAGESLSVISDRFGISVTRISRIIKREKEREAAAQVRRVLRNIPEDVRDLPAERVLMMYDALVAITGNRLDLEDLAREWGVRGTATQLPRLLARAALNLPIGGPRPAPLPQPDEDII